VPRKIKSLGAGISGDAGAHGSQEDDIREVCRGLRAFKTTKPSLFNRDFDKWKAVEGPIEILGRAFDDGVELIYWRKKGKS
jgi:hypothetical protein